MKPCAAELNAISCWNETGMKQNHFQEAANDSGNEILRLRDGSPSFFEQMHAPSVGTFLSWRKTTHTPTKKKIIHFVKRTNKKNANGKKVEKANDFSEFRIKFLIHLVGLFHYNSQKNDSIT